MKLRIKFLAALMPFIVALSVAADDSFPTLKANGTNYTNVTVTAVTATDIYFTYDGGMGNAKLESLSPELQTHFHYNAATAAAQEQQQAQANAGYLASQALSWGRDLSDALVQAGSENRRVLMEFTGPDWHGEALKLDQEVLSTSQFAYYAQTNLVLVRVEFPHDERRDDHLRREKAELANRYNVNEYPTCILLDSSGNELGRQVDYSESGPEAFMAWLESFSPTAQPPAATTQFTVLVARLNAVMVPKFGEYWYVIACIPSSLVLLTLIVRKIGKARQEN